MRPLLILGILLIAAQYIPAITTQAAMTSAQVEAQSARIGWTSAIESDRLANDIAYRVNEERQARGLQPLVWHEGLADLARLWSEEMIANGYRHSPRDFRVLPDLHGIGENILMGFTDSGDAHVGWMTSDSHRHNILLPEYTAIGIGVVCRNDGLIWATQLFGMPRHAYPTEGPLPSAEPMVRSDPGPGC